jgi:branched-chain amino acid transport system substrate-binding protein
MRLFRFGVSLVALVLIATACTSSGNETNGDGGGSPEQEELVAAAFSPFTGPNAPFGPEMMAGCVPAANSINDNGGILGSTLSCEAVDSEGDPAAAVPAANNLIATTSNLFGVVGPTSNELEATAPLFNQAEIPMFSPSGLVSFNNTDLQFFYRLIPSDDIKGYVLAYWADQMGFKTGAAVFGNDAGSQSNVPTLLTGYENLGDDMAVNMKLAQDQSSYRTEVAKLIQADPDVIFTEASPQTSSTFLKELQQQGGLIPIIGTDVTLQPPWLKAVAGAIGQDMEKYYVGEQPYASTSGPAYEVFKEALLASGDEVDDPRQWSADPYSMIYYDSVVIMALAATAANSVDPAVYNEFIVKVTDPSPDATVVHSYGEGVGALENGDTIRYEGAGGKVVFNEFHNNIGVTFEFSNYNTQTSELEPIGQVSGEDVASLIG